MEIIEVIIVIATILVFIGCVSGLAGTIVNMLVMFGNIRGDVKESELLFNRFNVIFRSALLEDDGVTARKKLLFWLKVLLISSLGGGGLIATIEGIGL